MTDQDTCVWIDPARRSGEPCIGGSRIGVEMAADTVWHQGIDSALDQWPHLTRPQILVACWYAGAGNVVRLHGKGGKYVAYRGPWRKRWGAWAADAHQALWESDYDAVADPPTTAASDTSTESAGTTTPTADTSPNGTDVLPTLPVTTTEVLP